MVHRTRLTAFLNPDGLPKKKLLEALSDGPWDMFAHQDKQYFCHVGSETYCRMSGSGVIVPVLVEIDPEGTYYGWQDLDDREPCMIWHSLTLFVMCFGSQDALDRRIKEQQGRMVRLSISQISNKND